MAANPILIRPPLGRRTHLALRALALGVVAVSVHVLFLDDDEAAPVEPEAPSTMIASLAGPAIEVEQIPAIFPAQAEMDDLVDGDAITDPAQPQLIGIAGRLPDDAEVLLRLPGGGSTALGIGEGVQGYVLKSVAADRAVLVKDGREVLLTMPRP